ncbi:hypothetical protein GCM10022268_17480 [Sphingomonas cynarae]|uniref:Uncharacterized protein n=2 Tax=Sphingomonas cynarae TaxID=930197 RepID=A0ABP7DRW6_9SPHN
MLGTKGVDGVPKLYPWDYHSDLTAARLVEIAKLLRQGRHDAVDRHDDTIGDDNWVLGVRAYNCGKFRVMQAHDSGNHSWLTIINPSLQFIFAIGHVPVRFYRGDADDPSEKTCRIAYPELTQLAIAFQEEENDEMVFRFAVETYYDGSVDTIKFVGLRHKQAVLTWEIPLQLGEVVRFPLTVVAHDEGTELAAPMVGLLVDDEGVANEDG